MFFFHGLHRAKESVRATEKPQTLEGTLTRLHSTSNKEQALIRLIILQI